MPHTYLPKRSRTFLYKAAFSLLLAALSAKSFAINHTGGHGHASHSVSHSSHSSTGHAHYYLATPHYTHSYHSYHAPRYHCYARHSSYNNYYYGERQPRWPHTYTFSGGKPFETAEIVQHYHMDNPDVLQNGVWVSNAGGRALDTTLATRRMSTCGFSLGMGVSTMIARLGKSSAIPAEIDAEMIFNHWNVGTVNYSAETWVFDSAYSVNLMMPVSVQYRWGGEIDHKRRLTCAVGGGAALSLSYAQYIASQTTFTYRPFVMAEAGVVAGIPIKLRATWYPDIITYINQESASLYGAKEASGNIDGTANVRMTGGPMLNMSLILSLGSY